MPRLRARTIDIEPTPLPPCGTLQGGLNVLLLCSAGIGDRQCLTGDSQTEDDPNRLWFVADVGDRGCLGICSRKMAIAPDGFAGYAIDVQGADIVRITVVASTLMLQLMDAIAGVRARRR
jgi:hypothetical protein